MISEQNRQIASVITHTSNYYDNEHLYVHSTSNYQGPSIVSLNKRKHEDIWGGELGDQICLEADSALTSTASSTAGRRTKKQRLEEVKTEGFQLIQSAFGGMIKNYYKKNLTLLPHYQLFLDEAKPEIIKLLTELISKDSIKFNLKLEGAYKIPHTSVIENRSFKTAARTLCMADNDLHAILEEEFNKLMHEEEVYTSKGSGFSIDSVNGLLLSVYRYKPIGGSSYIKLPDSIEAHKAIINVKNNDEMCFKYSIMAKYVDAPNPSRISHYLNAPENYDFSELNYPVEVKDVKKFEKRNPGVSVNVYGLKMCEPTCNVDKIHNRKNNKEYIVVPYKICDQELNDHFDLLLFNDESTNGDKYHYAYIKNFSRLVRSQIINHRATMAICKRCFKGYIDEPNKPDKAVRLAEHKRQCVLNKPVAPIMPTVGSSLRFQNWGNTHKHDVVIYADFEAMLVKNTDDLAATSSEKKLLLHITMNLCHLFTR
ncbi:uncharacterized protein LOC126896153 [Daktulosphaira vitifoliae]|uniref:uncharacterized protein LOC126896153 n=1 Tax=Daktulosphaira vitifoliae TaxID=58002 RepID=UPI0021AA8EFB|nr:uncharacterized protein LOC126896153 [Daktulosphaira vitifoliae]XP_050524620.1 uncharacterized protein LOC126896153 [Daktulosphaira vitifoliae]